MEDNRLEAKIGRLLLERGWMVATAESCTGGLILHRLTNVSGCSAYVAGGIVSYTNAVKQSHLGVSAESLAKYTAVSEQVAREMALGVLNRMGVDVALSVTGIAGPGGSSPEQPVGLTYIGLAMANHVVVEHHIWQGDREANKAASAERALQLLYDQLCATPLA